MNEKIFFGEVRKSLFGGKLTQAQIDGMNGLFHAFSAVGDQRIETLAYGLATAYHETGRRMVPVREGFATTDAGARQAVNNLAAKRGPKSAVARYAKPAGPHGYVYYGRGHVQLTWLENYQRSSADAGTDLVKNPDAMLDPVISARVLFRGLLDGRWNGQGKGIAAYTRSDGTLDAVAARRLVNVQDKAREIAGYHAKFLAALRAAGWRPGKAAPIARPATGPVAPSGTSAAPVAIATGLAAAVAALWQWGEDLAAWLTSLF